MFFKHPKKNTTVSSEPAGHLPCVIIPTTLSSEQCYTRGTITLPLTPTPVSTPKSIRRMRSVQDSVLPEGCGGEASPHHSLIL